MAFTTVIVNFVAKPGQRDAVTAMLGQALQKTIANPDCFKAVMFTDDEDADRFYMVQEWTHAGAHKEYVKALMDNPQMAEAMALLAAPPDSRYTQPHTYGGGQWGGPGHLELSSTDTEATAKFLTDVFGWRFQSYMPGYDGFWAPTALMGGLRPKMDEEPAPQTVPYLIVENLEASMAAVEAAGGTIVVPIQTVEGAGRFFWFLAPGGLTLAAWQEADKPAAG